MNRRRTNPPPRNAHPSPVSDFVIRISDLIRPRTQSPDFRFRISARHRGFTLVELMISIALVLILLLGVNFVFRTAVDAVSSGERLIGFTSDARTAQAQIANDFDHLAADPPCFVIASQIVPQFLNADDAKTGGGDPTIYIDSSANPPQLTGLVPAIYDYRFHRADLLRYFVHGLYKRRTGNDGTFISTTATSSQDAFVTLGHLMLPTRDGQFYVGPTSDAPLSTLTVATNTSSGNPTTAHLVEPFVPQGADPLLYPTQFQTLPAPQQRVGAYASDWVLGRSATLLRDPSTIANGGIIANTDVIYPRAPQTPAWPQATWPPIPTQLQPWEPPPWYGCNLTPLGNDSVDNSGLVYTAALPAPQPVPSASQSSRYDVAGVTVEQFRRYIADAILQQRNASSLAVGAPNAQPAPGTVTQPYYLWWNPLVYNLGAFAPATATAQAPYAFGTWNATINPGQFNSTTIAPNPPIGPGPLVPDLARQEASPQINNPLDSTSVAQMAPYLLEHCSQFIVEYAGDYIQQDNNSSDKTNFGAMTGIGPDGQIDYVADVNGNRRIRWYGMPRSTSGMQVPAGLSRYGFPDTGTLIRGYNPGVDDGSTVTINGTAAIPAKTINQFVDVIPLRDYYWMYQKATGQPLSNPPWEVDVNFDPTQDYGNPFPYASYLNHSFPPPAKINPTSPPSIQTTPYTQYGQFDARYAAVWYNDMPAMIRILIKVDDPNNKVKDGPWYEMVFRLK